MLAEIFHTLQGGGRFRGKISEEELPKDATSKTHGGGGGGGGGGWAAGKQVIGTLINKRNRAKSRKKNNEERKERKLLEMAPINGCRQKKKNSLGRMGHLICGRRQWTSSD